MTDYIFTIMKGEEIVEVRRASVASNCYRLQRLLNEIIGDYPEDKGWSISFQIVGGLDETK